MCKALLIAFLYDLTNCGESLYERNIGLLASKYAQRLYSGVSQTFFLPGDPP